MGVYIKLSVIASGAKYVTAAISSFSFPDITEFALRKSIVRALKIFHGLRVELKDLA